MDREQAQTGDRPAGGKAPGEIEDNEEEMQP
jgi:hypothetical protein